MRKRSLWLVGLFATLLLWISVTGSCDEPGPVPVRGVVLLLEEILVDLGLPQLVFGQLTLGGEPVPDSQFVIGFPGIGTAALPVQVCEDPYPLEGKEGGQGPFYAYVVLFPAPHVADGAQMSYILHDITERATGILECNIPPSDFYTIPWPVELASMQLILEQGDAQEYVPFFYHLPFLPIDPPGEADIAFF